MRETILFIFSILVTMFKAYTIMIIWNWHIFPVTLILLDFIPIVIVIYIYGLVTMDAISLLKLKDFSNDDSTYIIVVGFTSSLIVMFIGWIFT